MIVDDIIATGKSAVTVFKELCNDHRNSICEKDILVFICAICGTSTGMDKLEAEIKKSQMGEKVYGCCAELLTGCFSQESDMFKSK